MDEKVLLHATKSLKPESNRIEPVMVKKCSGPELIQEQHVPDRFRIIFVQNGTGTLDLDGAIRPWVAPALFCINEHNSLHMNLHSAPEDAVFLVLYFHPQFLNKRLNFENIRIKGMDAESDVIDTRLILCPFVADNFNPIISHLSPESAVRVLHLYNACSKELSEQPSGWWPCKTRSFLTELLFLVGQLQEKKEARVETDNGIVSVSQDFKPVLDYIMRLYNTPLTLKILATEFATNRTTFNQKFKKETGVSAINYLIDLRLRIASSLLASTDLPVSEIASRIGCGDVSHFERQFKRKYGRTAASYRATIRK